MRLNPETILKLDRARLDGLPDTDLLVALEEAGLPAATVFNEYMRTPLGDGRLRGEVNLDDPAEWSVD